MFVAWVSVCPQGFCTSFINAIFSGVFMINWIIKGVRRLKSFSIECKRVFKITKKPSMEEFKMVSKVAAIGVLIIGALGFLVHLVYQLA